MNVTLEMYNNAKSLITCAPAWICPKEEICFHLAKPIMDAWESQQAEQELIESIESSDEIADYAPNCIAPSWEYSQITSHEL